MPDKESEVDDWQDTLNQDMEALLQRFDPHPIPDYPLGLVGRLSLVARMRAHDIIDRAKWWLPGGVCVIKDHDIRGQFCVRCGWFYP